MKIKGACKPRTKSDAVNPDRLAPAGTQFLDTAVLIKAGFVKPAKQFSADHLITRISFPVWREKNKSEGAPFLLKFETIVDRFLQEQLHDDRNSTKGR